MFPVSLQLSFWGRQKKSWNWIAKIILSTEYRTKKSIEGIMYCIVPCKEEMNTNAKFAKQSKKLSMNNELISFSYQLNSQRNDSCSALVFMTSILPSPRPATWQLLSKVEGEG